MIQIAHLDMYSELGLVKDFLPVDEVIFYGRGQKVQIHTF
jgi:hypothetical protein